MIELDQQRIDLSTGVTLNVATAGPEDGEPILFLHGFPESHRSWRNQIAALSDRYFCIAPDQRGYAKSDKPEGAENYAPNIVISDVLALADHFGIESFTLAGHDWGGAIAWGAAITHADRIDRLIIANAPHPYLFQKALYEEPEQRAASQYIRAFRDPESDAFIARHGFRAFLEKAMDWKPNPALGEDELAIMLEDWKRPGAATGMLNWYRATPMEVPADGEDGAPPAFLSRPFPALKMPTLVVWALDDEALRPGQLEGLDGLIDDLTLVKLPGGHFVQWEQPERVSAAIRDFLAARPL